MSTCKKIVRYTCQTLKRGNVKRNRHIDYIHAYKSLKNYQKNKKIIVLNDTLNQHDIIDVPEMKKYT